MKSMGDDGAGAGVNNLDMMYRVFPKGMFVGLCSCPTPSLKYLDSISYGAPYFRSTSHLTSANALN